MATRIIEQWFKGATELEKEGWEARLDERLDELERTMGEWYQALRFGPLPGQTMDFHMRAHDTGGFTPSSIIPVDVVGLPDDVRTETENEFYDFRPIMLSASIFVNEPPAPGSSLDFNVLALNSTTGALDPVLVNDMTVTDTDIDPVRAEVGRGDFTEEKYLTKTLFLVITAINAGIPRALSVHFFCNQSASFER